MFAAEISAGAFEVSNAYKADINRKLTENFNMLNGRVTRTICERAIVGKQQSVEPCFESCIE